MLAGNVKIYGWLPDVNLHGWLLCGVYPVSISVFYDGQYITSIIKIFNITLEGQGLGSLWLERQRQSYEAWLQGGLSLCRLHWGTL